MLTNNWIMKNKWMLIVILMLFGIGAYFLLAFFFHVFSVKPEILIGEANVNVDSDEFIGLVLKIPGSEKEGHWELNVTRLESKNDLGSLTEINGEYLLNKKPIYYLSAESGTIQWETRVLQITGQVSFRTNDGKVLRAEQLTWDPNNRRITAVNGVVLEAPGLTVIADKFNGDFKLDQVKMSGITKVFYHR